MIKLSYVALGQTLAFLALVLILGAAVFLGLTGHDWLAGIVAGAAMVSAIGLFITARYRSPNLNGGSAAQE